MSTESLSTGLLQKANISIGQDICVAGRWMYERGYIVACEGNLSVRLDEERILTTPTCMNKGMLTPNDLVVIDLEGRHLAGDRKASSELAMHLLFYRMRPGRAGDLPRASAHCDRLCRRGARARPSAAARK